METLELPNVRLLHHVIREVSLSVEDLWQTGRNPTSLIVWMLVPMVSRASGGNSYLTEGEEVTITATIWCWNTGTFDYIDFYYASDASNPVWTQTGQRQQCPGGGAQNVTQSYTLPQGSVQQAVRVNVMYLSKDATDGCVAGDWNDVDDLVITVVQSSSSLPSSVPSASPSDLPSV
eukprot:scaffold8073_cov84-Skeletonema_menzelii.AAC.1